MKLNSYPGRFSLKDNKPARGLCMLIILTLLCVPALDHASVAMAAEVNEEVPPNVLVIHAYHPTYDWTKDVTKGILAAFAQSEYSEAELYFEYIDARRHTEPEYREILIDVYRKKYNDSEFDLIIAVDDHAIDLICSEEGIEIFGDAPVVFCGANAYDPSWKDRRPQMTGIMELLEPVATAEAIFSIQPEVDHVIVINDNISLASTKMQTSIVSSFEEAHLDDRIEYMGNMPMHDVLHAVSDLPEDSAVLLALYTMDADGRYYSFNEYISLISTSSNVPVYGLTDTQIPYGIIGGKVTDGEYDGKVAAEMGIRILSGEKAEDIPIISEPHALYIFNWEQMERFSIPKSALPEESIIVNGNPSFYDQYRMWIWAAIIVVLLQSLSIGSLIISRKKLTRTRTDMLNAKHKAEENERLKSAFLANMSHEIRTPMNAILGFSEMLKNPEIKPEKSNRYIELIISSGKNLVVIINDILDISRIEAGEMVIQKRPFHINAVLDDLYDVFSSKIEAEGKNVELKIVKEIDGKGAQVNADESRFRQILINLLGNAFKFTDQGSIEYGYSVKGNIAEFYVKDTGTGIHEQLQRSIFDRFHQVGDGSSAMYKGTGLGLAISKSLVNLMDGKIWVESVEGEGSTFYFTLELAGSDS